MDRAEQLADLLAGDLDPTERTALEAELDRDPSLRAQFEAMRRADAALAGLTSPRAPAGFEERLDRALASEFGHPIDEVAERRARRATTLPVWVTATSGAAAAILILAGGGLVLSGVLGGSDDDTATFEAQADIADSPDTDARILSDPDEEADSSAMSGSDGAADSPAESAEADLAPEARVAAVGPLVVITDRTFDDAVAADLLTDPDAFGVADQNLDERAASLLREGFTGALRAIDVDGAADESPADTPEGSPAIEARIEGAPSDVEVERIVACLADQPVDPLAIPVYVGSWNFAGAPAIVIGTVSADAQDRLFTVRRLTVLDRARCTVMATFGG